MVHVSLGKPVQPIDSKADIKIHSVVLQDHAIKRYQCVVAVFPDCHQMQFLLL